MVYKQVLVPLDGSPLSAQVVPYTQFLSVSIGIDVELFHVLPSVSNRMHFLVDAGYGSSPNIQRIAQSILSFDQMENVQARLRQAAQEKLDQIAASFPEAGEAMVRSVVGEGHPAEAIAAEAAKLPGTLLVMTSHGRPGSVRWWLGSVTDKVLHLSSAPTLVIPPHNGSADVPASIEGIILPLDGSVLAEAAIPHAAFLAKTFQIPVRVIQAIYLEEAWWGGLGQEEWNEPIAEVKKYAKKYVDDVAQRLQADGVGEAEGEVAQAHPAVAISEAAARYARPLIVMSTYGHGGMARLTRGSIANRVLQRGMVPILLVHP